MIKKHVCFVFTVTLGVVSCATSCPAGEFTEIVALGASLTDGGNVFIRSADIFPAAIPPSPPYHNGRFSNGPNYIDVLAQLLSVPPLLPSENGGTNYAWGAATSGLNVLEPLVEQVDEQVSEFLDVHTPQPDQLFVFGAINDFNPDAQPKVDPVQSAAYMRDQIEMLIAAGGKHFLIGDLPSSNGRNALAYNKEFHRIVGELRTVDVSIYQFDLAGTIDQIIASPTEYGITDTTSPACSDCGGGRNPNPVDIVDNPNEHLLWDNVHYTGPVNRAMGQAAFDATRVLLTEDFGVGGFSDRGFNDGGLDNWTIKDSSSDPLKPWGPGIAEVQDGALRFQTTGEVPPRIPEIASETGVMIATLDRSADDERFSNGFLRSTVHAKTASDANLVLRGDPETLSGYLFSGLGPLGDFGIFRFENGEGEFLGSLDGPDAPEFTLDDDWVIEAGAVGDVLSMKVWRAGEQEPSEPQLVVRDDVLTSGQIGIAPAISTGLIEGPTQLDVTYDDVQFRLALLVCGDFDFDNDVDSADRTIQTQNWTGAAMGEFDLSFAQGDCDADGDIDTADQNGLIQNWTGAQMMAASGELPHSVIPEPSSAVLLLTGWCCLIRRRSPSAVGVSS